MSELPLQQSQRALSYMYGLLGQVFLKGVTAETYEILKELPEFSEALASFVGTEAVDFDEAAASHQQLFGFQLFPFQSVLLGEKHQVGGEQTNAVLDTYEALRYHFQTLSESPDHIGVELDALAMMCGRAADALEDDDQAAFHHWQGAQVTLLDTHLLKWAPVLLHAVVLTQHHFYNTLADVTLELLCSHREDLPTSGAETFMLPEAPALLENEKTGLRDIVKYLLTPAWSGLTLSRDEIKHISHTHSAPSGFGQRQTMLNNVLRSAIEYDALEGVLDLLIARCDTWQAHYQTLKARQVPTLSYNMDAWMQRVEGTAKMLKEVQSLAASLLAQDEQTDTP